MRQILATGHDYSWFILTQSIIEKEFALSGSEQNPDLTGKSWRMTIKRATNKGAPAPDPVGPPPGRGHFSAQDATCGAGPFIYRGSAIHPAEKNTNPAHTGDRAQYSHERSTPGWGGRE